MPGLPVHIPYIPVKQDSDALLLVHPKYESILRDNDLCDLERLFATSGDTCMVKKGLATWRQRLRLTLIDINGTQRFYLKRYDRPPIGQQIRRLLNRQRHTADAEWNTLHLLAGLGFRVPTPVAYGGVSHGWFSQRSLILTAEVPGESLEKWIPAALRDGRLDRNMKTTLTARLSDVVAALHRRGLVHRDLYLAHVFLRLIPDGDCELSLIDLHRVKLPLWRLKRWFVKDLASLNYSTPSNAAGSVDRLRFLKQYLGREKLSAEDKAFARAIAGKTRRIARHSSKHGLG